MTSNCYFFKFLRPNVDGKDLMCFQRQTSLFKFLRCRVGVALRYYRSLLVAFLAVEIYTTFITARSIKLN